MPTLHPPLPPPRHLRRAPQRKSAPPSRSSSIKDYSLLGCGLAGLMKVDKDGLRRKVVIPDRLAEAIAEAVRSRDIGAGLEAEAAAREAGWVDVEPPEAPLVVFINSRSGGRYGSLLKGRLQDLIGEDQEALQKDFGAKIGDMLWNYCHGIDNRNVAEVQCNHFLTNLCKEVSLRLQGCGVEGRTVTLKVKKRKQGAAEPLKFMGCGDCENMSRSITMSRKFEALDCI